MKRFLIILCLLLSAAMPALAQIVPVGVEQAERRNINLFLTNFSEQGMVFYSRERSTMETEMVDFAVRHLWYNRQDLIERGQWGNDNVRVSDERIGEIVRKYFGCELASLKSGDFSYRDGYYYWQETGGWGRRGFVSVSHVESMGDGRYGVYFGVYGDGEDWTSEAYALRPEQAAAMYPACLVETGYAVIDVGTGSLKERETWTIRQYDTLE